MDLPLIREGERICARATLSDGSSLKFQVLEGNRAIEAFVIRFDGKYYAYKNRCAHMALTLDLDDNDFFTVDNQSLICKTHGAVYRPESGFCFSGPCCGEYLAEVKIEEHDGGVYLVPSTRNHFTCGGYEHRGLFRVGSAAGDGPEVSYGTRSHRGFRRLSPKGVAAGE